MTKQIYTVTQLNRELRGQLESNYRSIWVEGEISSLASPTSGHLYFSLKEKNAVIRCAYFRNRRSVTSVVPKTGMQVLVCGQISLYESRGDLQLIVSSLEEAGEGALRRAFDLLKQKLLDEGLFSEAHKKPLPPHPTKIGIITSNSGAALHDILTTLRRRYPSAQVILYPVLVQGDSAPEEIENMLAIANQRREVDVLILARGGGSLEDLQAFNDEKVARAIFASDLPVVSGVGHEVDFTIADMVSDLRAATPTAAAERVSPDIENVKKEMRAIEFRLKQLAQKRLEQHQQTADYLTAKLVHPARKLQYLEQTRKGLRQQLQNHIKHQLDNNRYQLQGLTNRVQVNSPSSQLSLYSQRLERNKYMLSTHVSRNLSSAKTLADKLKEKLSIMSPNHTLNRGYAIVQDRDNKVVTDAQKTQSGDSLRVTLADGLLEVVVDKTVPN